VAAFEAEFGEALLGGRGCVAVNSGTAGLHLGLLAAGIGPGDEVVVPSFTFAATANAVRLAGATPVFADIDPATFCITPDTVAAVLTDRTTAVMPVHLYGHPADLPAFVELCGRRSLALFEDAAQAHGSTIDEAPVGTFGAFALFSLYPTKNMTSGEGGMVAGNDEVLRLLRLLRNQGMERRYANEVVGFNARMTDVHAAIGRVQLQKLAGWTERRRTIAAAYDAQLEGVVPPPVVGNVRHVYHQYTIRVADDRDGFARTLREEHAVDSGVYYPTPVHRLPSFGSDDDLPETFTAAAQVLSLPVHPSLSDEDVERVIEAVNTVAKAGS
jgi:dTDP-4-amino-4,6-dideoxygalactose transaminase